MSYFAQTRLVNVSSLWLGALRLQIEASHAFVGVHNEHFLHHRRRGRGNHSCGVLGNASLRSRHLARPPSRPFERTALFLVCRRGTKVCKRVPRGRPYRESSPLSRHCVGDIQPLQRSSSIWGTRHFPGTTSRASFRSTNRSVRIPVATR